MKNTDRILTMSLMNYLYDYDGELEVLEYILFIVQKKNKDNVIPENIFIVSILVNIF